MTFQERVFIRLPTLCGWTCSDVGVVTGACISVDCIGSGTVNWVSSGSFSCVCRRCW